jgi:hypothetical protein
MSAIVAEDAEDAETTTIPFTQAPASNESQVSYTDKSYIAYRGSLAYVASCTHQTSVL